MSLIARAVDLFEAAPLTDGMRRQAVSALVAQTSKGLRSKPGLDGAQFAQAMRSRPIAEHTDAANAQHYEVPAAFFQACLGPHLKYSCCLYNDGTNSIGRAEERALAETCAHAGLGDGQTILELGCGWGSLTLWMAEHYPNAQIAALSNSASQRAHIEAQADARNLTNIKVITSDINVFDIRQRFDRIVSVEMFEHMSNWRLLLENCRRWLKPEGQMLIHIFAHQSANYRFDPANRDDWVAQHFFAGGVMPSRDLIANFADLFTVEQQWWWSGKHYERTALDWLTNFDANRDTIRTVLAQTYGRDTRVWEHRWRLFFLATAGLFAHKNGEEWGVVHHLLKPTRG